LACMTANREPSNQSFEIDREATVCTASRRFLPFERTGASKQHFFRRSDSNHDSVTSPLEQPHDLRPRQCIEMQIEADNRR
jgi:hypothetical protein